MPKRWGASPVLDLFSDCGFAGQSRSSGGRRDFYWADQVCSLSSTFCHNPEYLAYAGGVMLVIAIGAKLGSLAN
jgi:hypothetical protein